MIWLLFVFIVWWWCTCSERFLPISGSEPVYRPSKWNRDGVQEKNNCYSYLLDDPIKNRVRKPQPGYYAGISGPLDYESCKKMFDRVKADNKYMYLVGERERCQKGWYKGYLALDSDQDDYHFYRQDRSGLWSHKPGSKKVRQYDGDFKVIYNPRLADKRNDPYFYNKECGYICVPVVKGYSV